MSRIETCIYRCADAIANGFILTAYNALGHEDTTCGPYHEAVEPEHIWQRKHFAITAKGDICSYSSAPEAASSFVGRVGTGRALEAIKRSGHRAA